MDAAEYLRIVSLRKGKLKATEFRLRPGERGMSLFARTDNPPPADIVAAVRAAGKQGELAAAVIPTRLLRDLGLVVVATPGGTPVPEVNRVHTEAQFPRWRAFLLRLQGRAASDFFNERFSDQLAAAARILE